MTQKKTKKKTPASVRCKLDYKDEQEFIENYAPNISKTGIFAKTKKPKAVGEEIKFEFLLADGAPVVRGKGEVTWNRRSESASGAPAGMGIKFVSLEDEGEEIVKKVMEFKKSKGDEFNKPSLYSMAPPSAGGNGEMDSGDVAEPISPAEADSLLNELLSDAESISLPSRKRHKGQASDALKLRRKALAAKRLNEKPLAEKRAAKEQKEEEEARKAEEASAPEQGDARRSSPPENLLATAGVDSDDDFSGEEIIDMLEVDPEDVEMEAEEIDASDVVEEIDVAETEDAEVVAEPEIEMTQEEVEGILDDVYNEDAGPSPTSHPPAHSSELIHDDDFDDILDALEEGEEADVPDEDVEEIDDLDVLEIKD